MSCLVMKLLLRCCVIASVCRSSLWDEIKDFMDGRLFSPQLLKQLLLKNVQFVCQMSNNCILSAPTPPPMFREQLCATYRVRTQRERCSKPQRQFPINLQSAGTLCPINKPGRLVGAFLPKPLRVSVVPEPVPEVYPPSHLATGGATASAAPAAPEQTFISSSTAACCWH